MSKQEARERLPSKKNHVYWERGVRGDTVIKIFTDKKRFIMEKKMGDLLQGTNLLTPIRLSVDETKQTITYQYIKGLPVVEIIEQVDYSRAVDFIGKICAWMVEFYFIIREKTGCSYILGDIHLRNFIYEAESDQIYGFDFEECRPGKIETDVARLYVFILHYDPAFTPGKIALAAAFLDSISALLPLDKYFIQQEIKRETAELITRRSGKKTKSSLITG